MPMAGTMSTPPILSVGYFRLLATGSPCLTFVEFRRPRSLVSSVGQMFQLLDSPEAGRKVTYGQMSPSNECFEIPNESTTPDFLPQITTGAIKIVLDKSLWRALHTMQNAIEHYDGAAPFCLSRDEL